jgi:hypothetical protein
MPQGLNPALWGIGPCPPKEKDRKVVGPTLPSEGQKNPGHFLGWAPKGAHSALVP